MALFVSHLRFTVTFASLLFLASSAPAQAPARFDLSGPKVEVRVTRAGKTLPIAAVPNLQPGDKLWLHPDLPPTQSVHYLLVAVFLRGTTNPPPDNWFIRIPTWSKNVREEGVAVIVPDEAQQAILLLAPETGGDFSTLRSAVRGRPGIFVRASQDLAEAGFEQARIEIGMPSSVRGGFQGSAQAFQASLSSEPILIALALVAVYIVLGILYESFIHPLTILSTLPSAGVGALVALLLMKVDLSVIAMIGIILLIGIVKKNAIMMIDFALVAEREGGKTPEEAIYEACLLRFRPIMMTTMAALLGGLPLALGTGTGSELRRPLGITIVGGLIVSQCLTLFTTPVVYLFFDRLRLRAERLFNTKKRTPPPHALPVTGD